MELSIPRDISVNLQGVPGITVTCTADSHEPKFIAQFFKRPSGKFAGEWTCQARCFVVLEGDDVVYKNIDLHGANKPETDRDMRQSYELKCELCRLDVTRRAEKMHALLDELETKGLRTVPLRALAAFLK
jgi:hypothetical protein